MTTFEICNIVLNAIVAVLVVGYGLWLRNVFKHQIGAKDATIEAKDAEISRLRADAAPAIADAYAKLRAHADQMTRDVGLLNQKLEEQTKVLPQVRLNIEAQTQVLAVGRLLDLIGPIRMGGHEAFRKVIYQFVREMLAEADERIKQLPDIESASHERPV